jgi:hypothetical protein
MNVPVFLAAAVANAPEAELLYIWRQATPEAKAIIVCLAIFSITAWSVMIAKGLHFPNVTLGGDHLCGHGPAPAGFSGRRAHLPAYHASGRARRPGRP